MKRARWLLLLVTWSASAQAGGVDLALGLGGTASAWAHDQGPRGWGVLGYRVLPQVTVEGSALLGYAPIDERVLVGLGLGASLWGRWGVVEPMARLTLLHFHEEPRVSVQANVVESLFGVGDGIRHRMGAEAALGAGVEVASHDTTRLLLGASARVTAFPDERGPRWYAGGDLWATLRFGGDR